MSSEKPSRWRLAALGLVLVLIVAIGHVTGFTATLSAEGIRRSVEASGPLGVLAFIVLFAVGELVHVPGLVFIGAAVALWGPLTGGAIAAAGALVSLVTSFAVVRGVGGRALEGLDNAFAKRVLAGLERRPIATIFVLRAVLILSPPVTYALALSPVRFRDYLVGSALGLVPPLAVIVIATQLWSSGPR